jgi:pilus assembly protein CpaE
MTTLVETDAQQVERLRVQLPGDVTVLPSPSLLEAHLERHPSEFAVVIGPSIESADVATIAERNRIVRPALGILLVRTSVDSGVLATSMRAGVREVVAIDDGIALSDAVRRAEAVGRAMSRITVEPGEARKDVSGGLLTVFSAKGGAGKSLVATNLAVALADQGLRVCVADLDIEGGDVSIMMSLAPQHTLADLSAFNGTIDRGAVESLLIEHSERLSVMAAPVHLGTPVSAPSVGEVLAILKTMFDVVVVDTSGSFDDPALQAIDHSDLILLLGTLDIPSLKNMKLAAGTLDLLNVPRDLWRVVINRADPKVGLTVDEVEKTLGLAVTTSFPTSRDVLVAVNRGEAIVRVEKSNPVSKALTALAQQLARELAVASPSAPVATPRPGTRGGARRRLRSKKQVG